MNVLRSTGTTEVAANRDLLVGIAPFVIGLVVVAILVVAVWWGIRIKSREAPPPRPQDQPRRPADAGRPGEVVEEKREPDAVPQDGIRRTPQQIKDTGGE
ncbi:DUF6479 family protein [Streptomyces sp. A5-4]|uniref:DUF6479 family protein n=1 Tax=Streptomyces sp. A5-4 TaxID=3384771 RepID=UPI003DAA0FAF